MLNSGSTHHTHKDHEMNEHQRISKYCEINNSLTIAFSPDDLFMNYCKTDEDAGMVVNCMSLTFTSNMILDKDGRRMQVDIEIYNHLIGFDEVEIKFTSHYAQVIRYGKCLDLENVHTGQIVAFVQNCLLQFYQDGHAERWQSESNKLLGANNVSN